MRSTTVTVLRAVLAVTLAGSVFVQAVMVPLMAIDFDEAGGGRGSVIAFAIVMVLGIGTAQVTAVCVWRLVGLVRDGTVFSPAAFRFVDVMVGAAGAATLLACALGVILAPGEAVAPGVVLLVGGGAVVAAGIGLIELVLRTLLAQAIARDVEATELRAELDVVI